MLTKVDYEVRIDMFCDSIEDAWLLELGAIMGCHGQQSIDLLMWIDDKFSSGTICHVEVKNRKVQWLTVKIENFDTAHDAYVLVTVREEGLDVCQIIVLAPLVMSEEDERQLRHTLITLG